MTLKSSGSALISALFIMTLVAIAATAMSSRLQLDIYRARMLIQSDKLYLASEAVTFWAMNELSHQQKSMTTTDQTGQVMQFPTALNHIYPDVSIKGSIIDLQSRFNLNNLQNNKYQATFFQLFKHTFKQMTDAEIKALVTATTNWINPPPSTTRDELLEQYAKRVPPYFPAYQPMKNSSEFRMIHGVTAQMYQTIESYITALLEVTPLNLNTASKKSLMMLGQGITETQAEEIVNARGKKGISKLASIQELLKRLDIAEEQISLESHYFLSVATVTTSDLHLINTTILKREQDKKGKITIKIISEVLS